ncbi:ferredoxin reductase-like C-terminal NADP-linked domain-containing protein [Russula earlei]|uniref:Ferredoxin reductase-like C-terminal NADP-linked domain-containing protein n=1 Tax=Russula earlei TaxID=71964 RepID=A0ACC0UM18_9AGAM|nr:ferredoxin reductase-like C-terminal NADP-linked domain-containing protein [Russula earlei]
MIRSHLLRTTRTPACLLSTSASTGSPPPSRRLRLSSLVFLTSAGVLISSYFLWPSKYRGRATFSHQPLSPSHFIPVTVSEKSHAGPDLVVLTLLIPPDSHPSDKNAPSFDTIWSIFIKDDDIQVERPYTPLFGLGEEGDIKLWVKRYPRGEVGRWLHTKQAGDTIEIRGPMKTFPFQGGKWDEVVMISGGTGFSPFHQLLFHHLLHSDVTARTRFTLLHASRSPAELPPLTLLQPLIDFAIAHPEYLRLELFVDSTSGAPWPESVAKHLKVGRVDRFSIAHALGISDGARSWFSWFTNLWTREQPNVGDSDIRRKNVLVLVCGPERMVAAIAGPYGKNYSQGKVGGVLAELGFTAGQVWKL